MTTYETVIPTQPPTGLGIDACIEFDWVGEPYSGVGTDWDTLNVTLRRENVIECITSVRSEISIVNGVAQTGYTVYATPTVVEYQTGYHVILCPTVPFNELEIITVIVSGDDTDGNSATSTFYISTVEITPPTILNMDPEQGDTGIDAQDSVYFEMHDSDGVGVDIDTVSVNIDDSEAVIDGVVQSGFSLSVVNNSIIDEFGLDFDGYEFTISRDVPFTPGKQISVEIDGYDAYGNRAIPENYYFTVAAHTVSPVVTFSPIDGATGLNRNQNITVTITDTLGVDQYSVDISVNGNQAVSNGLSVAPFDVYRTDIVTIPGIVDGHSYLIDTELDFDFNETVEILVTASDLYDNITSATSSFTTLKDNTAPTITNISPRDEQIEVSLAPDIAFTIRHGYDIAFDETDVVVNGEYALQNGLVQSGYSLVISRISDGVLGVEPGDGYHIYLTRTDGWAYNETVEIVIETCDRGQGNLATETVTWYTISPEVPVFEVIPGPGDTDVALDINLEFEAFADGYGIDPDTLNFLIDGNYVIRDGYVQEPNYIGSISTIVDDEYYIAVINPRYLLASNATHSVSISAKEKISEKTGVLSFTFKTGNPPENPETLYLGGATGVLSILTGEIDGHTEPPHLIDGYYVNDLSSGILNEINKLAVATRSRGVFFMSTNYEWPNFFYSDGDEITEVYLSTRNSGTLYMANRTKRRVDVYYNLLSDDIGRSTPDVYYNAVDPAEDGYAVPGLIDGYFTDMVVTEGTSSVTSASSTIFLATEYGVFKIDTDESVPGVTEINGQLTSYGIVDSGYDYDILEDNTNKVVAIDVNTRLNYMYVATRGVEVDDLNAITYVDLTNNSRDGVIPETRLMDRLVNDLDFQD